jgi:hypothetical protein
MKKTFIVISIIVIFTTTVYSSKNSNEDNNNYKEDKNSTLKENYSEKIQKLLYYNWKIKSEWNIGKNGKVIITSNNSIENKKIFAKTYSRLIETFKINQIIFEDINNFENNISYFNQYKEFDKFDLYYLVDKNIIKPIEFIVINYPNINILKISSTNLPIENESKSIYYLLALIGRNNLEDSTDSNYINLLNDFVTVEKIYEKNPNNITNQKNYNNQKNILFNYYIESESWIKSQYKFFSENSYKSQNISYNNFFEHFESVDKKISNLDEDINSDIKINYNNYKNYFYEKNSKNSNILSITKNYTKDNEFVLVNLDNLRVESFTKELKKSDISYIVLQENNK